MKILAMQEQLLKFFNFVFIYHSKKQCKFQVAICCRPITMQPTESPSIDPTGMTEMPSNDPSEFPVEDFGVLSVDIEQDIEIIDKTSTSTTTITMVDKAGSGDKNQYDIVYIIVFNLIMLPFLFQGS